MKKQKIGFILNIATICLAIVAIVVGVYSLQQAKLNMSGSIGFSAHYVNATIATTIKGSSSDGATASADKTYSNITFSNEESQTTQSLALDTRYFTNIGTVNGKPEPIKVYFTITNSSIVPIKATVTLPDAITNVERVADKESIKIDTNSSGTIVVTFTVLDYLTEIPVVQFNNFNITLEPFTYSKSDIEVKYDASGKLSNYYIEYGTNQVTGETKLKWYIIGKYSKTESETVESIKTLVPASDLTTVTANTIYKMKDTITYAFMSDYILPSGDATSDETKYVPFNNNGFKNTTDNKYYSNEYTSVPANDYSISTVRAYLNGKTVNTATDTSTSNIWKPNTATDKATNLNFFTQNTLKNNNIYTLIQLRTLGDMYKKMSEDSPTDLALPTDVEGILGTDADAFWLLSYNEAKAIMNLVGKSKFNGKLPTSSSTMSVASWWLRTPILDYLDRAIDIFEDGDRDSRYVYKTECGVRPAFLI